jgi:hypothetical protein
MASIDSPGASCIKFMYFAALDSRYNAPIDSKEYLNIVLIIMN